MAEAVRHAIETGEHLAVQAGTGTGKSLAYLVPAVRHAVATSSTIVVATATIALQRQLIDRDLPRLVAALKPLLDREPVFAILKGRRNYLCLHRQKGGVADDPQDVLFEPAAVFDSTEGPTSPLGRQVKRLHEWADQTTTGDRDELVPGVPEAAWRQVSVSAQECIGAQRCPFGSRCFAEKARDAAARADIVVTNHALLAIDATSEIDVLPDHDVVIIDEAHDLVDRVTSATTGELSGPAVDTAARRAGRLTESAALEGSAYFRRGRPAARGRRRARHRPRRRARGPAGRAVRHAGRHLDLGAGRGRSVPGGDPGQRGHRGRGPAEDGGGPGDAGLAGRPAAHRQPDPGRVRRTDHRTGRGGLAGPAVRRGCPPSADAAGGAARGRPGAAEPAVRPAHGGADLGHARPRRLVRPPGHPVGFAAARRLAVLRRQRGTHDMDRASTSARRSTTRAAASCTWPGTCRRRAGTSCPRRT